MNRFRRSLPALLLLVTAVLFFIGAYIKFTEHYANISESSLSLVMVVLAALSILVGLVMSAISLRTIFGYDKDT